MEALNIAESERISALLAAEAKAVALFDEVLARGIIAPGAGEIEVSDTIRDLAAEMFGTGKFWHKRIVRAGINTLAPYDENPPNRIIGEDDICFLDFGPVFAEWEADFGRTYVLGDDPAKLALRDALEPLWQRGRDHFEANPDITGAQLYTWVVEQANNLGWEFTAPIAGHLVGEFPHKTISGKAVTNYIAPGSTAPMRRPDPTGKDCHWILEIHLIDRERNFGGFFEQLLDLRSPDQS
ncbi:aminopeptidase P family protein [Nocardia panacis]|uniref:Aminopeptidase P family protein n=1 Tax=Nocardia panacis TaxID=2340916 RepID=A0A3A4KDX8_9NOCA|nr:M24 family metallopeptidase [Nocardia panacis]RJO73705.1 aminopeptidase P family protein [Nocardia panacis]